MTIPASAIVNVQPGVVTTGGSGLNLLGLFLTNNIRVPIGAVYSFANAAAVSSFFGPLSVEASLAQTYFNSFDSSTIKPARVLVSQYPSAAVGAYLRGGAFTGNLAALQAIPAGTITVTVDGVVKTSSSVSLAAATSFSNAAALIQAAFTSPGFTVSYDTVSQAFLFANTDTGTVSTIGFGSGSLATALLLTQATGAVTSQGSAAYAPGSAMDAIVATTTNFASFTTVFQPSTNDMLAFAAWANGQSQRYMYAAWEASTTATATPDTSSFGYQLRQLNYSGTANIYDPNNGAQIAALLLGYAASLDFTRTNGRSTAAFRSASAISPGVTGKAIGDALIANGYNFYGGYATANQPFNFLYPGQISGPFAWIDSYVNQIQMNAAFQLALMNLLTTAGSVPYNADGYAMIEAALNDQIRLAVSFGAIRSGVTLTSAQIAQVNGAAGRDISTALQQNGWYVICLPATPQVRAARQSPTVYFFYTDGQSVQQITLNSVIVQ